MRPPLLEEKMYFCDYFQYVHTLVYFSHKLVCCPPPTWTNTLHRSGVKVLGTFLIEPHTPAIDRLFAQTEGHFDVAKKLAAMAQVFGFDGWLLNIEKEFAASVDDCVGNMIAFIENLNTLLGPEGNVVWYDALNGKNEVEYQNGLTLENAKFATAAGALFTNYEWAETEILNSSIAAQWYEIDTENVFFGIDVWAQNTNMTGHRRITFPREGGGGTLTGLVCCNHIGF